VRLEGRRKPFGTALLAWEGQVPSGDKGFVGSGDASAEHAESGYVADCWGDVSAKSGQGQCLLGNLSQSVRQLLEAKRQEMWRERAQGAYTGLWAIPGLPLRATRGSGHGVGPSYASGQQCQYVGKSSMTNQPMVLIPDGDGGEARAVIEERVHDEEMIVRLSGSQVKLVAVLRWHILVPFQAVTLGKLQGTEFTGPFNCCKCVYVRVAWCIPGRVVLSLVAGVGARRIAGVDAESIFLPQMFYMLFSRAMKLEHINIIGELRRELVQCSTVPRALDYVLFFGAAVPWVDGYRNRDEWTWHGNMCVDRTRHCRGRCRGGELIVVQWCPGRYSPFAATLRTLNREPTAAPAQSVISVQDNGASSTDSATGAAGANNGGMRDKDTGASSTDSGTGAAGAANGGMRDGWGPGERRSGVVQPVAPVSAKAISGEQVASLSPFPGEVRNAETAAMSVQKATSSGGETPEGQDIVPLCAARAEPVGECVSTVVVSSKKSARGPRVPGEHATTVDSQLTRAQRSPVSQPRAARVRMSNKRTRATGQVREKRNGPRGNKRPRRVIIVQEQSHGDEADVE
jgi:hypothetical protein